MLYSFIDDSNENINFNYSDRFDSTLSIKNILPKRGEFSPERIGNDIQHRTSKHELEQLPMFDYQFGYLLKPHQTEVNLDIPRGGNATRKDKVISCDALSGFDRKTPSISNPLFSVKTPILQPVPTLQNTPNKLPQKGSIIQFKY